MIKILLSIGLAAMFIGCATKYKDSGFTGGYTETRLDENIWTVRFEGNGYTSTGRNTDYCMLRCAELCLENGFSHFIIASSDSDTSIRTHTTPSTASTTVNSYTGKATTTISGGNSYTIETPRSANTIVCFKEKPERAGIAYSAQFVRESIMTKYKLNK